MSLYERLLDHANKHHHKILEDNNRKPSDISDFAALAVLRTLADVTGEIHLELIKKRVAYRKKRTKKKATKD